MPAITLFIYQNMVILLTLFIFSARINHKFYGMLFVIKEGDIFMNATLTFEQLLYLPNRILEESKKYTDDNQLLSKKVCSKYNQKELYTLIRNYIERFKDSKYLYHYSITDNIKVTSTYGEIVSAKNKRITDPVGDLVRKHLDQQLWVDQTYNTLIQAAPKLTRDEAIYFVEAFFNENSEEKISEMLGINRSKLRNTIKASCLVKIGSELNLLNEEE